MERHKKKAKTINAHLAFVDESGFQLCPSVRRSWGLRGNPPSLSLPYKRGHTSVISALTLSAKQQRPGLYCHAQAEHFNSEGVARFVRSLLRHLRGNVILIWDNLRTHRGRSIRKLCRRFPRLHLESLPPYAPELNADEQVWSHLKDVMANGVVENIPEMIDWINEEVSLIEKDYSTLRSFFHECELKFDFD